MPTLFDHRGAPVTLASLREPQSAGVGALRTLFAGGAHPARGLTPERLHRILEAAEAGELTAQAELGAEMEERDAHLYAELAKRKRALLTLPWRVEPPPGASAAEERAAARVEELLGELDDLEDAILNLADAIGHGFACLELEWGRRGGAWLPVVHWRPPTWFTVAREAPDTPRLLDGTPGGAALRPFGWLAHVHKARSGYLGRAGLHRVLAWPYLFRAYAAKDLAELLEIYGLPLRLGKYPVGASEAERATLLSAVVNLGHDAGGIIPDTMAMEFVEVSGGRSDPFGAMIAWCERSISKAILGGTLTSQADGKSSTNALGLVHNEVRRDLLLSDARQIAGTLTRDLVHPLALLNVGGVAPGRSPRFLFEVEEPEDLALLADALPKLAAVGARIPVAWVNRKLQIPEPEGDEPVLGAPAPASPPAAARRSALSTARRFGTGGHGCPHCAAARARGDLAPDAVDPLVERAALAADPLLEALVAPLRRAVAESGSHQELLERLEGMFGAMESDRFAELIAAALVVAEQTGRAEVLGGH